MKALRTRLAVLLEDQARRAGVPQNAIDGLMGHLNATNEADGYGRGFRFMPDVTAKLVAKMAAPEVAANTHRTRPSAPPPQLSQNTPTVHSISVGGAQSFTGGRGSSGLPAGAVDAALGRTAGALRLT